MAEAIRNQRFAPLPGITIIEVNQCLKNISFSFRLYFF